MLIIADTSALVALAACDALSLLDKLFQEVRVPPAVFRECTVSGKPEAERLGTYLQDKVSTVDLDEWVIAVAGLGQGELEAMALYKRLHADRLLVDDYRARRVANLNGIEVVGSLGVLLRAKESGLIPEIRSLVATIEAAGVHYSEQLVGEALRLAGERSGQS
jgi:predicted nucleic acid-binding protein